MTRLLSTRGLLHSASTPLATLATALRVRATASGLVSGISDRAVGHWLAGSGRRWGQMPRASESTARIRFGHRIPLTRIAGCTTVLVVAASAAACRPAASEPSEPLIPTSAGVVADLEQLPNKGRTFAYRLESGVTVEIDLAEADVIGAPGGPGVGNLLLAGRKATGQAWVIGLPLNSSVDSPPGCFRLIATGVGSGRWIDMSNGLRLMKSEDFDPGSVGDERYTVERFAFCLNAKGEVISYGI